jgi:hypothetical protein
MRRRAGLIAATFAGAIAIAVLTIVVFEPLKHEATAFEVPKSCGSDAITKGAHSSVLASRWESGVLVVHVSENSYCSDSVRDVSAQIIGILVLLRMKYDSPRPPTACTCEHKSVVRVSNLPQRDYRIMRFSTTTTREMMMKKF